MSDDKDNVTRPIFGAASGFGLTPDGKCVLGLDDVETQEILAILRQTPSGSNPHRNPRYRELYEKNEHAERAKLALDIDNTEKE